MLNILDTILDWIKQILRDCIIDNLSGMFDQINSEVGQVAANVGTTPAAWNAGVFSMIRSLSDNVIVPIAGMILTFVLCYELITMIIDRNNLHDLRGLVALGLQGFFIMVCVAIYAVLIGQIGSAANLHLAIWECAGYTVLLCFSLFKTNSVSRSILNAH